MTFQTAVRRYPDRVLTAAGVSDVRHAMACGLPVTVQGTGHGAVSQSGGVLLDTSRLDHVRIDPVAGVADVGAGATWGSVVREAARHGLAPLNGSSPTVGVVGYTLGGGLGPLARRYGYAADHVVGADLVLPGGELQRITAEDPDLFWALRGAGRDFGVVTSLRFTLFPVREVLAGTLEFDPDRFPEVLRHYREWTDGLPDELTSTLALMNFTDSPGLPPHLRGVRSLRVFVIGTEDCAPLLEPLREAGVVTDTVCSTPYRDVTDIFAEPTRPHGFQGDAVLTTELDLTADVTAAFHRHAEHALFLHIHHLGGALSRPADNSVGHRDAQFLVRATTPIIDPAPEIGPLHHSVLDPLTRGSTRRMLNFLFGDNEATTRSCYEPADYQRLTELKHQIDPDHLIRPGRGLGTIW